MRFVIAAMALALAACDGSVETASTGDGASPAGGYTMEIRAVEGAQTFLVTTPDGRTVGARAADGASALMDSARAQALFAEAPPEGEALPEVVSLRVPGFDLSISGDKEDANGDNGQVHLSMGRGNGQQITVRADEGGPGEADDSAYVRITGADEQAVRDFVADADDLSPETRTQMLTELGLGQ